MQASSEFELIVADDGSTDATRRVIAEVCARYDISIRHVWQSDDGFRKCRILNQAAMTTDADYLIFSDGDCIPRRDFVATHVKHARRGRFLSGGYIKLNSQTTAQITTDSIVQGLATDAKWLRGSGTSSRKLGRLGVSGWQAALMNTITPTRPTWNGHNSSCWRVDLLRVNGFDERMQYWAEDREFGERLVNAGIRGAQIRYSAVCVHLDHERPYKTVQSRERNQQIRAETKARAAAWTDYGIVSRLAAGQGETPRLARDVRIRDFSVGSLAARVA